MEWMLMPLRRYAEFGGRSRRREYWMFILFYLVLLAVATTIDSGLGYGLSPRSVGDGTASTYGPVELVLMIAMFVPGLAVLVRRLHDTGRSGWWVLVSLIPIVGGIVLIVWLCTEGIPGPNEFGQDPKLGAAGGVRSVF